MKRVFFFLLSSILVSILFVITKGQAPIVLAKDVPSPTPTYDPLAEPFVPENPSEYELGRNWYWHHCMPCHGDKGQGLTDEFRAVWPEDHQNCWGRGCHTGHIDDLGFPIPTVVPALVSGAKLAKFSSQQALFEYLKATHPPQHPGYLSDEQYRAIALYVFKLNDRLPVENFLSTPIPTVTPQQEPVETYSVKPPWNLIIILGFGTILFIALIWGKRRRFT